MWNSFSCVLFYRIVSLEIFRENRVRKTSVRPRRPFAGRWPLHPAVASSGRPGFAMVLCLADGRAVGLADGWAEQPSASRLLDVMTDQWSEWSSARADRQVEWWTACRLMDVRGALNIRRVRVRV
jgi:hypothetical protein